VDITATEKRKQLAEKLKRGERVITELSSSVYQIGDDGRVQLDLKIDSEKAKEGAINLLNNLEKRLKHNTRMSFVCYSICVFILILCAITVLLYSNNYVDLSYKISRLVFFSGFAVAATTLLYMMARSFMIRAERIELQQYKVYTCDYVLTAFGGAIRPAQIIEMLNVIEINECPSSQQKSDDVDPFKHGKSA